MGSPNLSGAELDVLNNGRAVAEKLVGFHRFFSEVEIFVPGRDL